MGEGEREEGRGRGRGGGERGRGVREDISRLSLTSFSSKRGQCPTTRIGNLVHILAF